ncbi:hypothetical protein PIB30_020809 [Stylosanthes scabra]|uniref:Uncharacterized protein n=1 Tax=Stylosanthes scabra TaxID=79078 RepID=A0ABU6T8D7_9FABA|nr:hypothetical protein [Stylosanthes scabra]
MLFSINHEPNLQQRSKECISNQQLEPKIANTQQDQSPQQEPNMANTQQDQLLQQNQHHDAKATQPIPLKEQLKQAFRNCKEADDNNNSIDIWNFRDAPKHKTKLKTHVDERGRKIIQRKTTTALYIVEVADEDEDMKEDKSNQPMVGLWEMELAQTISSSLRIKRERLESAQLCIEGKDGATSTAVGEAGASKPLKEDVNADMAEETGFTTPPSEP